MLKLTLGEAAAGQRLDRALADLLPEHSRTVIAGWIDAGCVLVDGRTVPRRHRVEGGEAVEVRVPPPRPMNVEGQDIPLSIPYEDEYLLVVDKPTGLTVHPGSGRHDGTLANALVYLFGDLPEAIGADRPGIVHRLDKDTSGVIVVAKSDKVQRDLSAAFAARTVHKTYLAIVHGHPDDDEGIIERAIGRHRKDRKKMAIDGSAARDATTRWRVEKRLPRHTLLRCEPVTGRTHQIRVHLKAEHLPIVGDPIYGHPGLPGNDAAKRLMLHAWKIAFTHPVSGEVVEVEAPLPPDYEATLEALASLSPPRRSR